MPISVPHFSQKTEDLRLELSETEADFWSQNACGIICTRMAIAALTGEKIALRDLLAFSKDTYEFIDYAKSGEKKILPLFGEKTGWLNYGLVKKVAARYGVFGRWYFEKEETLVLQRIAEELEKNHVVAASVRAEFDHTRGPHLVLVTGIDRENRQFLINDPLRNTSGDVTFDDFFRVFSGRLLIFSNQDSEIFRAMTPISIEQDNITQNSAAIIHVHGNEVAAYAHGKVISDRYQIPFFSLVQNGERFLRLPTGTPEIVTPETRFARLDANRIFSDEGLDLTIETLNKGHMNDEQDVADIKEKGQRIASAFLQTIAQYDTWIVVHNNFSDEYEYAKYGNFFGMRSIPPIRSFLTITQYQEHSIDYFEGKIYAKNAFVLVNTSADFEALRRVDINVALIAGHDEVGSLGEAADTLGKRYFCVETGYEDEQAREKIMQIIREILVPQK